MIKTGKQIQGDVMQLLKGSLLALTVNGKVYRNGYRPRNSRLEDIIVVHTAGRPDQVQVGMVNVLIYVPDIDPFANGVLVEDGARCEELELAAMEWINSLNTNELNYSFTLRETIQTEEDTEINQHLIIVKLEYKLLNY